MPVPKKILILGGTRLARQLAKELHDNNFAVTTALAGRTENPILPDGQVQIGTLGGISGLSEKLKTVDALIDATHPFAAQISHNAYEAARTTNTPLARLQTPPWIDEYTRWINCNDYQQAAKMLPKNAVTMLTIGRQNLAAFTQRPDCMFHARMIEQPEIALPSNFTCHFARPPFSTASEQVFMQTHKITHLVTKNAGGAVTNTKLEAAKNLGIAILMIARPTLPEIDTFSTPTQITNWLTTQV